MSLPAALPGRRERQVDSTRARLFEAAIAEFRRVGFARANVARIAREAGVSRPSFYFHFPTKEHVLLELQWLEERALAERVERTRSLRDALRELGEGVVEMEARLGDAGLFRAVFAIYAQRPAGLPIEEQSYPIVAALTRHFRDGAGRGELRPALDPEAAARVCLTSLLGVLIGLPSTPELRRADIALLFSLYLAENARPEGNR